MKKILLALLLLPVFTKAQIITTVAGIFGGTGYSGDNGPATSAAFYYPVGVAVDDTGNLYIVDKWNQRIRKVSATTGIIKTIAGDGTLGGSGDGGLAVNAKLTFPTGICLDANNNIFIADNGRVRKIQASTGSITTVAGYPGATSLGDGGLATNARLGCSAVFIAPSGNLYICDVSNSRIRKVDMATGIITTVAGNGTAGYSGDGGPATLASVNQPWGVYVDASENIYIADKLNYRIRKVDHSTGLISTIAGTGIAGYSGDGAAATDAQISTPKGVMVDANGSVYIVDDPNNRIRKVNAFTGTISTIAGGGSAIGSGGLATDATLGEPESVSLDNAGNLFIACATGGCIRKVTGVGPNKVSSVSNDLSQLSIYPNPVASLLTISASHKITKVTICNLIGQNVFSQHYNSEQVKVDATDLLAGVYFISVNDLEVRSFVKQ